MTSEAKGPRDQKTRGLLRKILWSLDRFVSRSRRPLVFLSLGLASGAPALAHDPYEAFASFVVHADRLELILTMAQSTALRLIDPAARIPSLTPENLTTHRPRLLREGTAVFNLTSGRKPLAVRQVEIELTEENDFVFRVTYPRPPPGRLHLHAAFVTKLGEGYGGIVEVSETGGNHLGWEQLSFNNLNLEVVIQPPPSPSSPKKSAT